MKFKLMFSIILIIGVMTAVSFGQSGLLSVFAPTPTEFDVAVTEFTVVFSHESGFYAETFDLFLAAPEGAAIFYTTDGSPPTEASDLYTAPIRVLAPTPERAVAEFDRETISRVDVLCVRAVAVLDGEYTEVINHTFVKGTDILARFGADMLIFSLYSDHHGLYDHHDGILVEGIDREEWIAAFTAQRGRPPRPGPTWEGGEIDPFRPANFNRRGREAEREVLVTMFDSAGKMHITQRAGMRVAGGYSRAHSQKSFTLYARDEYGDRNNFLFPFFGEEHAADGQLISRYRRIRLRNGGSDRDAGFVRDELSQSLFRQAGHPDTQLHTPAAVFLNGEYYGVSWLKSPRTDNHLSRKYGGNSDRFEIVEGGDNRLNGSWWEGEDHATADINEIFALADRGFTGVEGQARFEEFSRRVCLDNIVRYYAMQIYSNNQDWPNHNMELWRYFPTNNERNNPNLHEFLRDGKWRVFSHDLEAGWAIHDNRDNMVMLDTIRNIMTNSHNFNGNGGSVFLFNLLQRDDMKAKFANTFVDLMETAFSPDNIIKTLDGLIAQIQPEHDYALRMNMFVPDNLWWPSVDSARESHDAIRRFAQRRPEVMYNSIAANLGFERNSRFTVNLTTDENGGARMNSRYVGDSQTATANYFAGTEIEIFARANIGYIVSHWTVNGTRREGDSITVSANADVSLHFIKCPDFAENGQLYISAVKALSNDWIEIHNDTGRPLNTKGMWLSDSNSNVMKWRMPAVIIQPGDSLVIISRSNREDESLKRTQANFNVAFGERVRLSDPQGNLVSIVEVSMMSRTQIQRRLPDGRYTIVEIDN
jgi:hypothetical protein